MNLAFWISIITAVFLGAASQATIEMRADRALTAAENVRTRELSRFIEYTLFPFLPPQLASRLREQLIVIDFKRAPVSDGLFRPEQVPGSPLHIELKTDLILQGNITQLATHELFHALHYLLHPNEEPWIREGLAQLFEYRVLGYFNAVNAGAAIRELGTPLQGIYIPGITSAAQYGHDFLYFYYLWNHCGGDLLFWSLVQPGSLSGVAGIEAALGAQTSSSEACSSFASSALAFEIARAHNRVRYSALEPRLYYLWSTTLPRSVPTLPLQKDLLQLPLFGSLIAESAVAIAPPEGVERIWLQTGYPYEVRRTPPDVKDSNGWRVLFVRVGAP